MAFFKTTAVTAEETPLYDQLRLLFYTHPDMVRARRQQANDETVIHSIRNQRTKNTAVIKDCRNTGGGVNLRVFERNAHIAENVGNEQTLAVDTTYNTLDDPELISTIFEYLSKESDFSKTTFSRIKATKKELCDLAQDEVFAGRIVKITTLETKDGPAYDMQFENNSGTLIEMQSVVHKTTNNPMGQYVVINRRRGTNILRPQQFMDGFEITESDKQITRPADLMP